MEVFCLKKIEVFDGNELRNEIPIENLISARSFFMGIDDKNRHIQIPLTDDLFSKNMLFMGGIGTGKTNALFQLVAQLRQNITSNDVMIIFDTKGDFYREFFRPGDVVISNDRKATGCQGTDYWNLFNEIERDEHMDENITEIAKTLFHEHVDRSSQPFFPKAAQDLFSAILTLFCRGQIELPVDNQGLRTFLNRIVSSELRELLLRSSDLRSIVSYISDDRSPQTQGILSELQQLSREILLGNFMKSGNISIRQLVRQKGGRVIFIEYDLGIGSMLTPIYRLLFDMAIKESLCRGKSEGNVWFIADEFRLIPHLQHISDGVNFGRSLGVKFLIGVQNVDQIYEAYGQSQAKSILSGFSTTIAFRMNDYGTREFVKGIFGANRKKETYLSAIQSRGISENIRDAHVVEDWDISNLQTGEAIIGFPGKGPFKFIFNLYQK